MTAAYVEDAQPPQTIDQGDEAQTTTAAPAANDQPANDQPQPVFYRRAALEASLAPEAFAAPEPGSDGVREARLLRPLLVQSPTVALASPLWDPEEGDCPPHAHLALPAAFAAFAAAAEEAAVRAALANKEAWFRAGIDDRTIVAAFKPLCKASGHLRVALPAGQGVDVFDPSGEPLDSCALRVGDHVRCILRLDGVTIGRSEFWATWTLVQAQTRPPAPAPPPPPRCMLSAEDDD